MAPIVRSSSRRDWQHIPLQNVFYYKVRTRHEVASLEDMAAVQVSRRKYVMAFAFVFDKEDERYEFSYSFPYTYTDLCNHLNALETKRCGTFTRCGVLQPYAAHQIGLPAT